MRNSSAVNKLILFDIDGTLIDPGGAGRRSMTKAFQELFSIADAFSDISMAGKTDIQIIKEGLSVHGLPPEDGALPSFIAAYLKNLKTEINNKEKHIMPGVRELLNALRPSDGYWMGLLTGNIQEGARIKLGSLGLNKYFPFGAFGDDHEQRGQLLPVALTRFKEMTGIDIPYTDCIVIGDTPRDVECAKPYGTKSIAVATGPYDYQTLSKAGADCVLHDLSRALQTICAVGSGRLCR